MRKRMIIVLIFVIVVSVLGILSYVWLNAENPVQKTYPKAPLTVVVDWELVKSFKLQIFYTTEQNENFNPEHSVRKDVTEKDNHVEVIIPEDKIYKFRIDFGSNPKKVILKNVEIMSDQYINFNDWHNYAYKNIERSKINKKDNSLTILSTHGDPYMIWGLPFVLYKNE